ncbi:MAG: glycoside hydrolase family 88 protein [Clostridia bacterium]|nr:glycoside hydrolase family 88 protein [Clostridia bacterium]
MMNELQKRVGRAALAMQRYNWEQGVLAQAFLEAGETETAVCMAAEGVNRQTADGRCADIGGSTASTDPCAIGQALLHACTATGDPVLLSGRERLLEWALHLAPRNADGLVYHFSDQRVIWVDSMYMLPPFLACAGYYDEAIRQLDGYWRVLLAPEKGLLSHQWDDDRGAFNRRDAWGVGNGWAAAGMARVVMLLPGTYQKERERLIQRVHTLLTAAQPLQRTDGMFHDVLDDPCSFPELNCGQMLAYTVYRGLAGGWLDERFLPMAERAREASLAAVDDYGLVRPVCGMPSFDKPGVAAEGQAFFILMEVARADWLVVRER